jgi:hypothetical protein
MVDRKLKRTDDLANIILSPEWSPGAPRLHRFVQFNNRWYGFLDGPTKLSQNGSTNIPTENLRSHQIAGKAWRLCTSAIVLLSAEEVKFGHVMLMRKEVSRLNTATDFVSEQRANLPRPILFGHTLLGHSI